jgi:hypothetical protein
VAEFVPRQKSYGNTHAVCIKKRDGRWDLGAWKNLKKNYFFKKKKKKKASLISLEQTCIIFTSSQRPVSSKCLTPQVEWHVEMKFHWNEFERKERVKPFLEMIFRDLTISVMFLCGCQKRKKEKKKIKIIDLSAT